jgi:hypothetical protein
MYTRREAAALAGCDYKHLVYHLGRGNPYLPTVSKGVWRCLTWDQVCDIARCFKRPEPKPVSK